MFTTGMLFLPPPPHIFIPFLSTRTQWSAYRSCHVVRTMADEMLWSINEIVQHPESLHKENVCLWGGKNHLRVYFTLFPLLCVVPPHTHTHLCLLNCICAHWCHNKSKSETFNYLHRVISIVILEKHFMNAENRRSIPLVQSLLMQVQGPLVQAECSPSSQRELAFRVCLLSETHCSGHKAKI